MHVEKGKGGDKDKVQRWVIEEDTFLVFYSEFWNYIFEQSQ